VNASKVCVVESSSLSWPTNLTLPSRRFRLFVAADTTENSVDALSSFASSALKNGMVYFASWGPGCERFHDVVDEVIVEDDLGEQLFVGPRADDCILTTLHAKDTLDDAVNFFLTLAVPNEGFVADSESWVMLCVNNSAWAAIVRGRLQH